MFVEDDEPTVDGEEFLLWSLLLLLLVLFVVVIDPSLPQLLPVVVRFRANSPFMFTKAKE
jgi:hypothetical protein